LLIFDVLASKQPQEDVLDLLKKEKSMARAEHDACANAISESQRATASKVESTIRAMKEAKKKAEIAQIKMLKMKVQIDSITVVQNDESFMFSGPLYDEWTRYKDTGGLNDFGYYRLTKK
jgi:predicted transcriptional regulator